MPPFLIMKKILDTDPLTGLVTYHEYDEKTGKNIIEYAQDVEHAVDRSKLLAGTLNKKEEWWPIGHIPDVMILKWAQECGHKPYSREWSEYAMKQLNSREYRKFNQNKVKV